MHIRLTRRAVLLVLLGLAGVGAAMAATMAGGGTVKAVQNAKYGSLLATANGMTLYHYTLDKHGVIACTGTCAKFWPPLLVKVGAKPNAGSGINASKLGTVKRPNGTIQVVYAGFPLYRFSGDKRAGAVQGQGVDGKWFAVTPAGRLAKAPAQTNPVPSPTTTTPTTTYAPYP
jgi:predicted lipoprotein with Yx(FWY)xxD motif